jgi:hypothetical protein
MFSLKELEKLIYGIFQHFFFFAIDMENFVVLIEIDFKSLCEKLKSLNEFIMHFYCLEIFNETPSKT